MSNMLHESKVLSANGGYSFTMDKNSTKLRSFTDNESYFSLLIFNKLLVMLSFFFHFSHAWYTTCFCVFDGNVHVLLKYENKDCKLLNL